MVDYNLLIVHASAIPNYAERKLLKFWDILDY